MSKKKSSDWVKAKKRCRLDEKSEKIWGLKMQDDKGGCRCDGS
jgi:hypothetical protein